MAKLFCKLTTERIEKTQQANNFLKIKVFYGSKADSREAFTILVETNDKDAFARPKVTIYNPNHDLRPAEDFNKMPKEESEELLTRAGRDIEREEES